MNKTPTLNFDEWVQQTEIVTLPSGRTAELRRPDLVNLIGEEGNVPNVLANLVLSGIQNGTTTIEVKDVETFREILKALNVIAKAAFVFPELSDDPECSAPFVHVGKVPMNDKGWVFAWALGAQYQPAASFRQEPGGRVGFVPTGQNVRGKTKRPVRHKG